MMHDQARIIVGVPGMGNSEPSWHQRKPHGFTKTGRGRAQARIQTLRRPSTAHARLGNDHTPHGPYEIPVAKAPCWGSGGSGGGGGGGDIQDLKIHGVTATPYSPARRYNFGGVKLRVRPATAGSQRSPLFMSHGGTVAAEPMGSTGNLCQNTAEGGTASGTLACTRDRAGIIRNGRDGRAAPPATPPPPTPPLNRAAPPPQDLSPTSTRRRPSTAGASRASVCHFEHAAVPMRATDDFAHGFGSVAHRNMDVGVGVRPPPSPVLKCTTNGRENVVHHRVGYSEWEQGSPACAAAIEAAAGASGREHEIAPTNDLRKREPPRPETPHHHPRHPHHPHHPHHRLQEQQEQQQQRESPNSQFAEVTGQNRVLIDTTARRTPRHNNTYADTLGGGQQKSPRRRPVSATPMRTRNDTHFGEGYGGDNVEGDGWGGGSGVPRSQYDRGRNMDRDRRVRPRSASATVGARGYAKYDSRDRVASGCAQSTDNVQKRHMQPVVPDFVESEKKVLRFLGHLSEELMWGREDLSGDAPRGVRIRQVVLTFFLADGSLEIFERRQINSGEQGGLLVRRNLFKKRDGSFYGFRDLKVGIDIKLLGKSFRLTDCDEYTRCWYSNQGMVQPPGEAAPEQVNERLRVEHTTGLGNPFRPSTGDSRSPTSGQSTAGTEWYARQRRQEKERRFYKHDKQLLRFKAIWDDPAYGGVRRRYDLLFYLQDETVAMLNPREERRNSGRDEGPVYLRRQHLPKNWRFRNDGHDGDIGHDNESYVRELDLYVGGSVNVWGRSIRLVGCDSFTKEYYRSEHGIDMETSLADAAAQRKRSKALRMYRRPGRVYQHRTGGRYFRQREAEAGTQSTTHRCEKDATHSGPSGPIGGIGGGTWSTAPGGAYPPDRFKGRRIRCKALLSSSHPNDLGREFVITYDLGLDTLMVHELQRRNSGRPGGLFLVKGRHRRPASNGNGRYYVPQDLYLGASVPLATGHTLVVTEMDRASLAICEEFPRDFPLMDSDRILRRLKTRAQQTALNLRSELRHRAETAQKLRCSARFSNNQAAATAPPAPGATAMLSGWTAGKGFVGNGGTLRRGITSNASSTDGGCGGGRGGRCEGEIAAGSTGRQRARSGATWGLVGGWGDCPGGADEEINGVSEERGGAKSAGSPAPWATVHGVPAAAVARDRGAKGRSTAAAARGGVAGGEVAERIERGAVVAFEDEEAFRDAMDELGLLVGLGQQEVLTLIRAFIHHRNSGGRGVLWANMCDRISRISTATEANRVEAGANAEASSPKSIWNGSHDRWAAASNDQTRVLRRMQKMDVAWREVFSSKEASLSSSRHKPSSAPPGTKNRSHANNGILGMASLVQVMCRNGMEIDAGDATFVARCFSRGGGSQVDYNSLCDAVYPCDFSRNGDSTHRGRSSIDSSSSNNNNNNSSNSKNSINNNINNNSNSNSHNNNNNDNIVDTFPTHERPNTHSESDTSCSRRPWSLWDRGIHPAFSQALFSPGTGASGELDWGDVEEGPSHWVDCGGESGGDHDHNF